MKYIIDAYSWIEYLDGTQKGDTVRRILAKNNEIYTISLTIAEVISRAKRKDKDIRTAYETIIINSRIINTTTEIAKEAGILHAEVRKKIKDFGLADAFVLLTARKIDAKILTGDPHFKDFREAILI